MTPIDVGPEAPVSLAPPARAIVLPLSRRATEPVRAPARSVFAIVAAWAIAIAVIAVVAKQLV